MLLLRGLGFLITYGGFPMKSINPLLRLKMKKIPVFPMTDCNPNYDFSNGESEQ